MGDDAANYWPAALYELDSIGSTPLGEPLSSNLMFRVESGRIVVVHSRSVSVFDSSGRYLGRLGRRGSGPGEFQYIIRAGRVSPDKIWIWDNQLARITFLSVDSMTLSPGDFHTESDYSDGRIVSWDQVFGVDSASNSFLAWGFKGKGAPFPGTTHLGADQYAIGWRPSSVGHPGVVAVKEVYGCIEKIAGRNYHIHECRSPDWAVSPNGKLLAVALPHDKESRDNRYWLVLIGTNGDTLSSHEVDLIGESLTDSMWHAWLDPLSERRPDYDYDKVRRLPRIDPLHSVWLGDDGTTWVKGIARGDQRAWEVIDSAGKPRALVWVPDDIWMSDFSADGALATRDIPDGRVVLYRLRLVLEPGATQ